MKLSLFKTNFLHLKELEYIEEPPELTWNEPTPDIHIEHSGQDIKIQHEKYMPCLMNMLMMFHVHHLSTGMDVRKPTNSA